MAHFHSSSNSPLEWKQSFQLRVMNSQNWCGGLGGGRRRTAGRAGKRLSEKKQMVGGTVTNPPVHNAGNCFQKKRHGDIRCFKLVFICSALWTAPAKEKTWLFFSFWKPQRNLDVSAPRAASTELVHFHKTSVNCFLTLTYDTFSMLLFFPL